MVVGISVPRIDGVEKVTGAAKFTGDLAIPDVLEAKVLRSPLPHAAIASIDLAKAESLPGVAAILTRDDLKDIDAYYGNCLRDRAVVALDRVRFVGEPVAVVAAEDGLDGGRGIVVDRCALSRIALRRGHRCGSGRGSAALARAVCQHRRIPRRGRRGRELRRKYLSSRAVRQRRS